MSRIEELAELLLRDGYVDNAPDARLAAVHILVASEWTQTDPPRDRAGVGGATKGTKPTSPVTCGNR